MSLRPKFTLNKTAVQGARATINAVPFTELTSRRYPYPRVGTRAPDGMFPKTGNPGHNPGVPLPPAGMTAPKFIPSVLMPKFQYGNGIPLPPRGRVAPTGIPGPLMPKFQLGDGNPGLGGSLVRMPWGYMEAGPVVKAGAIQPHYMLDKTVVQGVLPASIYRRMMEGKQTTEFTLPPAGAPSLVRAPTAPALVDWGSVFGGVVLGGLVTLGMVYGVIPALAEWGAKAIRKRA